MYNLKMTQSKRGMECRNPSCPGELFVVQPFRKTNAFKDIIQFEQTETTIVKKIEMVLGPPVKLICSRCGHQVMGWIPNQAMINTAVALQLILQELAANRAEIQKMEEQLNKPIWKKLFPFIFSS